MVPDTAMDLGFHYFSSQMRYSSMFRNALSNMSGRLTNVASIAASVRIHVNNMRTHFERSNVFESEKVRSPRSRLKYIIASLLGINCLQICLMERRMASVGLPRKGKPIYKRSFLGPNLIGAGL